MIDGITIISQYQGFEDKTVWVIISVSTIILLGFISFIIALHDGITSDDKRLIAISILVLVLDMLCFSSMCFAAKESYKTYYRVTIDNGVSFFDIEENYDIVSRDGNIYTITDKS